MFGEFGIAAYGGSAGLFRVANQCAVSGPGASFGGILFNPDHVQNPKLQIIKEAIEGLAQAVAKQFPECITIHLRLAPDIYYPAPFIHTFHAAAAIAGWQSVGEVTHVVTRESYRPRKSTLRNARRATVRSGLCRLDPESCFDFLRDVKLQKGYRFNYSRRSFLEQCEKFPDRFRCFGVRTHAGELAAACFELFTKYWALLLNWDQTAVGKAIGATDYLLIKRLEELFRTGCQFVDMGTISDGRKASWGLTRYKENFGGHPMLRNSYLLGR
jgi:hypothetical protein